MTKSINRNQIIRLILGLLLTGIGFFIDEFLLVSLGALIAITSFIYKKTCNGETCSINSKNI